MRKKLKNNYLIIIFIILSTLLNCQSKNKLFLDTDKTLSHVWQIVYRTELKPEGIPNYPECVKKYFRHYKLDFPGVDHYFGTFRSGNYLIATHIFLPKYTVESIYLVHGYILHSGMFNKFIKKLIKNNYAVVAFDLPGHGFSSGDRGDIGSFNEYAKVIDDLVLKLKDTILPPPFAIIGHSVGGAAVLEYLINYNSVFKKHLLSAPLVRSDLWDISKTGFTFFGGVVRDIPVLIRDVSSDKEYIEFIKKSDFLRNQKVPVNWVKMLFEWNKKLEQAEQIKDNVMIIQGDKDIVVEWNYNLTFLNDLIPKAKISYIIDGKHDLFQETEHIREDVFDISIDYLQEKVF